LAFVLVCLLAAVLGYVAAMPPLGPIAIMVISRGIEGRFTEGRKLGIGAAIAEGTYAGVAWAFATLFTRYPIALPISRVFTSVVLVVVGIYFVRYVPRPLGTVNERKAPNAFLLGYLTSFFNPAIIANWMGVAAGIYSLQIIGMQRWMAIPFGLSATLGIGAWYMTIIALMTKYHSRLPTQFLNRTIRVMGGVLLLIAAWTLISTIRH
jgi:threonine/homoserine/homoserine lactone efflux protein